MRTLEKKVFSYIGEHQMLQPGERVVAGISGGADSVCLLFVLLRWKEQYGLDLTVVHINHGIRPEAGEDARFVEQLCERYQIPFYLKEADIPALARKQKCSEEAAGRIFRYHSFEEVAKEVGATKIAVAHNMDDRSETMLFHLFRGSGIKGLSGMAPVRDNIIRPLLCVERREIEAYLKELGQDFCHDVTNDADEYTRNRIRHHILGYAKQEIAPGCVQSMNRTAEILTETEEYLCIQTKAALEKCKIIRGVSSKENMLQAVSDGAVCLDCRQLLTYHPVIQKRVLLEALGQAAFGLRDISTIHVEALYELLVREGNRSIDLPYRVRAVREYNRLIFQNQKEILAVTDHLQDIHMEMQVFDYEKSLNFPQNKYTKWFDYDKMERPPVIRTRKTGDYLTIRDAQGGIHRKKLKDYFIESKILSKERDFIPLLADGSHIIWVAGYRISEYYKVCENTKRVLQVQLITDATVCTEEENGREN